jgi:iron complex outermembrane receptor protein
MNDLTSPGRSLRNPVLAAAVLAALVAPAAAVRAADEPAAAAAPVALEEVVVTAQRRSENLQKVPVAVSALSQEMLEQQGVRNVAAVATQVPNMQLATPYGDAVPFFSLRGVTSTDVSLNQSGPIALYVDEVYKGLPALSSLQIFDVDRVEVLRGPQGTLYGKNTTGGAVNIYTRHPSVNDGWEGNLAVGVGNLGRFTANGGLNIPLIDERLAGRIAFTRTNVDGYVENLLPGKADPNAIDDYAVRASLEWVPSDDVTVSLAYTQTKSNPTSYGALAEDIGPGGIGFGTDYYRDGLSFFQTEADQPGKIDISNKGVSLRVAWDVSDAISFTSVTSYDKGDWSALEDVDTSPYDIARGDYFADAKSLSQDFRLASKGDGALEWLVGAYYYRDEVESNTIYRYYYAFAGDNNGNGVNDCLDDFFTGCRLENEFRQVRTSGALYGQATYSFDNGLALTAGLRYTKDKNKLDYYRARLGYFDPGTGTEVVDAFDTITEPPVDDLNTSNWSGKLGVSYETDGGTLVYATASRGYRGGSFNGNGFFAPEEVTTAKPEQIDALEAGLKSQLWDQRARVNLATFYYEYKNQQFLDLTPTFLQVLYNAPKSTVWGAELETVARLAEPLTVTVAIGYLDATYDEITLGGQDLSGNRLTLAPKTTFSAGVDWTLFEGGFGSVDLHTDSRYQSSVFFDAFNQLEQDGYWVHDARLTYRTPNRQLAVAAWGKNLADEEYRTQRYDLSAFNFLYAQRGRPREYGLELSYSF